MRAGIRIPAEKVRKMWGATTGDLCYLPNIDQLAIVVGISIYQAIYYDIGEGLPMALINYKDIVIIEKGAFA